MIIFRRFIVEIVLATSFIATCTNGFAQDSTYHLLGDFEKNWQQHWLERKIIGKSTVYEVVVEEDSNSVLMGKSAASASGLWRMLDIPAASRGTITWRWKVKKALSDNIRERSKRGDDYAARLFVVFEPHFLSWKTRALCYVWSANQPVGAEFKSPYTNSLRTIVVQSGNQNKGKWIKEKRNIIADYQKSFGKLPEMITAVAIMVDTDNSNQVALAWFDDIVVKVSKSEKASPRTNGPRSRTFNRNHHDQM
ncbi:MAG: DUF3047 domain-containing protein [bacterium]